MSNTEQSGILQQVNILTNGFCTRSTFSAKHVLSQVICYGSTMAACARTGCHIFIVRKLVHALRRSDCLLFSQQSSRCLVLYNFRPISIPRIRKGSQPNSTSCTNNSVPLVQICRQAPAPWVFIQQLLFASPLKYAILNMETIHGIHSHTKASDRATP